MNARFTMGKMVLTCRVSVLAKVIHDISTLAILTPHDKHEMRIAALYPRVKPRGFTLQWTNVYCCY